MKKIFVTGTAGFIGFHLAKLLLAEGFTVVGYDGMTREARALSFAVDSVVAAAELAGERGSGWSASWMATRVQQSRLKLTKRSTDGSNTQSNKDILSLAAAFHASYVHTPVKEAGTRP